MKNINFTSGRKLDLGTDLYHKLLKFRYKLFTLSLDWFRPNQIEIEVDEFDTDEAIYVVALDGLEVVGCARLLPTISPYLLESKFKELLADLPIPRSKEIWELSRFSALSIIPGTVQVTELSARLMLECILLAFNMGIRKIVTVSPHAVLRLLKHNGYTVAQIGQSLFFGRYELIACMIEVNFPTLP